MFRMTTQEYQLFLQKVGKTGASSGMMPSNVPKSPKYRNRRVFVYEDGFVACEKSTSHGALKERYDSIKEYQRGKTLQLLERAGKISNLRRQVPLVIQAAFTDRDGKKHRALLYKADYAYIESGVEVIEDVKGFDKRTQKFICTEAFSLKWKQLQFIYSDKIFRLH